MNYCADTWILIELNQQRPKALQLLGELKEHKTTLVIPAAAYAEMRRLLLHHGERAEYIESFFDALLSARNVTFAAADEQICREAALLSHRFGISLADALNAATCKLFSCNALLSKDGDYAPLVKRKYLKLHNW